MIFSFGAGFAFGLAAPRWRFLPIPLLLGLLFALMEDWIDVDILPPRFHIYYPSSPAEWSDLTEGMIEGVMLALLGIALGWIVRRFSQWRHRVLAQRKEAQGNGSPPHQPDRADVLSGPRARHKTAVFLDRLAQDKALRTRFADDPAGVLREAGIEPGSLGVADGPVSEGEIPFFLRRAAGLGGDAGEPTRVPSPRPPVPPPLDAPPHPPTPVYGPPPGPR